MNVFSAHMKDAQWFASHSRVSHTMYDTCTLMQTGWNMTHQNLCPHCHLHLLLCHFPHCCCLIHCHLYHCRHPILTHCQLHCHLHCHCHIHHHHIHKFRGHKNTVERITTHF